MPQPLHGKRVLTTRPTHQSTSWCECLREAGAEVVNIPMLAIEPLNDVAEQQAIKNRILDFDQVEIAIFVSQNAVYHGVNWLEDYWPQLPQGPRYYAIGAATAEALSQRGIPCEQNGRHMNSEDLLALPSLQQVSGCRILVFRGQGGRTTIGDHLQARGAQVDYCELYRRALPAEAASQLNVYTPAPDAISVHSGETLKNLSQTIVQSGRSSLFQSVLICPSKRVADLAQELGFSRPYAALNASDRAMLEALQQALR